MLPILGSAQTPCCPGNAKFVVYPEIGSLTVERTCNGESVLAEQFSETVTSFRGQISSNGIIRSFNLEYDPTLFAGGVYDEVYLWMGAWIDAFSATGWISAKARSEIFGTGEKVFIGQANGYYPMIAEFADSQHSGWFGVPFPEETTPTD